MFFITEIHHLVTMFCAENMKTYAVGIIVLILE